MAIDGIAIGDGGGIAIGEESAYGTVAGAKVWQHAKSAGVGPRKTLRTNKQLTTVKPSARDYTVGYSDGPTVLCWNDSRAVNNGFMTALGTLDTNDFTIGAGGAPDLQSCSVWVDTGGHLMQYTGCKPTRVRYDFTADAEIVCTIDWLCRLGQKITTVSISAPSEAGIVMASALTTIELGGNALCVLSGYVQVDIPHEGTDRVCLGSSFIKEPQRHWLNDVTGQLNVELSDDTDNDTEAELDHFLGGTAAGDLQIGTFLMTGCYLTGEVPALAAGITQFPIGLEGQTLVVTTTT
jgi:hypothetical protein